MRDLLRDYADGCGTVLLSSHLLAEIEIIADDIVMIGQGRIVCQGSKAELLQAAGTVVRAEDVVALQHALTSAGLTATVSEDGSVRPDADLTRVGPSLRTTAAWRSPSSAPPTAADSRKCSSKSPATPKRDRTAA